MADLTANTAPAAGPLSGADRLIGAQGATDVHFVLDAIATWVIAQIVGTAPATLDKLDEIAAALGNDPNFATTILSQLAGKQPLDSDLTAIALLTTTSFGRALLTLADAAAMRSAAGVDVLFADELIAVPTNGGTVTIPNTTKFVTEVLFNHTGAVTPLTVNFPSTPFNGQKFWIAWREAASSITFAGGSYTILNNFTTASAGSRTGWRFSSVTGCWHRYI